MPGLKEHKHADLFTALDDKIKTDYDPEDDAPSLNENESIGSEDDNSNEYDGREHYEAVGQSALRQKQQFSIGPQYAGARVSRGDLESNEDDDTFSWSGETVSDGTHDSDSAESTTSHDISIEDGIGRLPDAEFRLACDDENENEEDDNDEINSPRDTTSKTDRIEVRRLMNESQKSVIVKTNKSDTEKGRAVKLQRATFDSLLNTRIRMQGGLIAINSFPQQGTSGEVTPTALTAFEAAEAAAIKLLNTLSDLRVTIEEARTGTKRKRMEAATSMSSSKMWSQIQSLETGTLENRESILGKWSAKAQAGTVLPMTSRLNSAARSNTIVDVIHEQLLNTSRLIKRTKIPRSCAPIQANAGLLESPDIFDDADFYGMLLKDLLEQRNTDSASAYQVDVAAQQWRASQQVKTRKTVDTRASKGRKLRYTVHEKLQNFMAPENRGTWGEKQMDEFFGSLLGKQMVLEEDEQDVLDYNGQVEPNVRLFR